ncbi:MAG: hypothetical protein ACTHU0_27850 [Kofleriaceae bacterium]
MTDDARKRYFRADDDGVRYSVVANDLEHARRILRECGVGFGESAAEVGREPTWEEFDAERAGRVRCDTSEDDRGRGTIPLTECDLGEWFCSEW